MDDYIKIRNFRDLEVWKKGILIVKNIYMTSLNFPKHETYGLISQMQRSAVSIPSNIAEGFNRFHNKEYKQCLFIALGSCAELETHVEIAYLLNYIDKHLKDNLDELINHESRMLRNLIKKL